jgi:hypothetical protein
VKTVHLIQLLLAGWAEEGLQASLKQGMQEGPQVKVQQTVKLDTGTVIAVVQHTTVHALAA